MVKIASQALCLSLLSYTIASPVAAPDTSAVEAIEPVKAVALEKRIAENKCEYRWNGNYDFTIWLAGWGNNDWSSLSGCGTGLLDNLRASCGFGIPANIVYWGCDEIHENPHDTRVTFGVPPRFGNIPGCVEDAITRTSAGGSVHIGCRQV